MSPFLSLSVLGSAIRGRYRLAARIASLAPLLDVRTSDEKGLKATSNMQGTSDA